MDGTGNGDSGSAAGKRCYTSESSQKSNNHHRHNAQQIHGLERLFNEGTHHPDKEARLQLSRELDMSPSQVKFWFQNKRNQFKEKQIKDNVITLRDENETTRREIDAMKEALKNEVCKSCGVPCQVDEDTCINQQKLGEENASLKEEIQRLSREVEKYTRMSVSQLNQDNPGMHVSQLNQAQLNQGNPGMPVSQLNQGNSLYLSSFLRFGHQKITNGPSHDLLLPGSSPTPTIQMLPFGITITDLDKSYMVDIASNAMNELNILLQSDATFWTNSASYGQTVLNLEAYVRKFPRAINSPNVRTESSKDSKIVSMNSLALVDSFMDANKWMEVFPTIALKARTIEVLSTGQMESQNGQLQLMYEELQVLSPLIQTRKFYFLRFCQHIGPYLWAIVDVSYDILQDLIDSECRVRRLPSGCYIQDLLNGHSKITWMEHMQIEDRRPIHNFYLEHIYSGLAFGAKRRLATLQRMCERLTFQMDSSISFPNLGGVNPSPRGRRNLMKLSQIMVSDFCASINLAEGQQLMISEMNDFKVHTTLKYCTNPGHPNNRVFSASTTIWLPFSPQKIFDFLRIENTRPQWDVVSNYTDVQEVGRIACGSHSWNYISILKASSTSQNNELILQESCFESPTALIVYCHVNLHAINKVISGECPSLFSLIPSGFTISPGGNISREMSDGALVTILLQVFETNATSDNISQESAYTINNYVVMTIDKIKAALN